MAEKSGDKTIFSLLEVTRSIQKTLMDRYKTAFWVKAEMIKLNYYSHSGHCYPELVEKTDNKVVAQVKSNLWKDDYQRINQQFLRILHEPLKDGIKILFLASITFDPHYGLALRIHDIDPAYTLGDLEKEKQETIQKLRDEGIYSKNKNLTLALLPKRIAVISVETSKGYADFIKVLETNEWGYRFFHVLFPSLLQGEKAVKAIRGQLKKIKKLKSHFDVVAIIRGGGGDVGLSCYNHYDLAKEIANFPLPVITGIGHATNETVSEMISYSNAITPTKIAEFLIQQFHNFSVPLQRAEELIASEAVRILDSARSELNTTIKLFRSLTDQVIAQNKNEVGRSVISLQRHCGFLIKNENAGIMRSAESIRKGSYTFYGSSKQQLKQLVRNLKKDVVARMTEAKYNIDINTRSLATVSAHQLSENRRLILQLRKNCSDKTALFLQTRKTGLFTIEKNVENMSPANVLKRGFSISLYKGRALKNQDEVKEGDTITTLLWKGEIESIVQKKNQEL